MKPWTAAIDPSSIPDEVLASERRRRNALRLGGRPKVMRTCARCRQEMGTVELRKHHCKKEVM